jgi:hypothetical protein
MDTQEGDIFSIVYSFLTTPIQSFLDLRSGKNTQYSMKDIALLCTYEYHQHGDQVVTASDDFRDSSHLGSTY